MSKPEIVIAVLCLAGEAVICFMFWQLGGPEWMCIAILVCVLLNVALASFNALIKQRQR